MAKRKKRKSKPGKVQRPKTKQHGNTAVHVSQHRCYRLELVFAGPLISQAVGTLAYGVDTAMQRHAGQPVINGSLIRGNLRHALNEFAELLDDDGLRDNIAQWFGAPSQNGFAPQRSSIDFDFFWKLQNSGTERLASRTRIAIEDDTGKVKAQALQVIEDLFPPDQEITFAGELVIHFRKSAEWRELLHWLARALDYIPAMGSFKGIGFGRLRRWKLEEVRERPPGRIQQPENSPERLGFTLTFSGPFCLGRPRTPDSNRIVSEEFVSGNVLKAIVAKKLGKNTAQSGIDELLVTHALARTAGASRAIPIPLSLALADDDRIVDMAWTTEVEALPYQTAVRFAPDWKSADREKVEKAWCADVHQPVRPPRLLAVRTEINPAHNVAEQGNLFTQECIDTEGFTWCGDIDLGKVESSRRTGLLRALAGELHGIGKTHARATLSLRESPFDSKQLPEAIGDGHYLVLLVTAARLLAPGPEIPAINGHESLKAAYADYWKQQVHRDIELITFFSRQELHSDWAHRQRHGVNTDHRATWLTAAGSVFHIKAASEGACTRLAQVLRYGLPPAPEASGQPADWKTTPWLAENGFGEIVVNHPRQLQFRSESDKGAE